MAIVINGSGTVTGISVGGLPDGIVDAGTLATNSVDSAELIDGSIDNSHLADDAVDSDEIAAGAIDAAHLASGVGGLYSSVAIICDSKAYNANGGTFTSGDWRTRDLNRELIDADGIVSISSNQFTLAAGTYTVDWSAPAYKVNRHSTRLYNATDTAVINYGSIAFTYDNDYVTTTSIGSSTFTLGGSKALEIQHRCVTTAADEGLGNSQTTDSGAVSIYALVKILKHS